MEREVGGGIGMGNTCKPMAVSFQCMAKFTTNKKINKKNKNKKIKVSSHHFLEIIGMKWLFPTIIGTLRKANCSASFLLYFKIVLTEA